MSSEQSNFTLFKYKNHVEHMAATTAVIGALITVIYGGYQFGISTINEKIKSETSSHAELLTAQFIENSGAYYSAAQRYREIYKKSKKESYPQDVHQAIASSFLQAIANSGYVEEFQNWANQIAQDKDISLQKNDLNILALIYIKLGTPKLAIETLEKSLSMVVRSNMDSRITTAESHWFLTLAYLELSDTNKAIKEFEIATSLNPLNFRTEDLIFKKMDDIEAYIANDDIWERIKISNQNLAKNLWEFSNQLYSQDKDNKKSTDKQY